ncbi:hypothetical protein HOF40_01520 [Candidatus Parcubacteria bacterium]|jgi:hypothetical protein|nr:hypothetical protein [Candidatus Parcubacteria bacterium]MBT3948745.1 hypothetical protein [Candidatus Parcubacteria bacterium]
MFDDQQPKNAGNIPGNLPVGDPEDILAGADDTVAPPPGLDLKDDIPAPTKPSSPTALGAGVLKPKIAPVDQVENIPMQDAAPVAAPQPPPLQPIAPVPDMDIDPAIPAPEMPQRPYEPSYSQPPTQQPQVGADMTTPPPGMAGATGGGDEYALKEPIGSRKTILWIVIAVIVLVLGVGSVWIYMSFMRDSGGGEDSFDIPVTEDVDLDNLDVPTLPTTPEVPDVPVTPDVPEDPITDIDLEDQILFGEPVDTDGDGLDDVREADLNTDALNWDTDGDGLGDGDEVTIWKTDPLDEDTDNDTYSDGAEIKNGYSPTGPGKLFELPTSTEDNA